MPTQKQINQTNAASFAQLLEELLAKFPAVKDVYYCDHTGVWCVTYPDGDFSEYDTFEGLLTALWGTLPGKPVAAEGEFVMPFHKKLEDFTGWAEAFFAPENSHTDRMVEKAYLMEDLDFYSNVGFTSQLFMKMLKGWASKRNYVVNPAELQNNQGRIIRRGAGLLAKEMIYVQTPGQPINDRSPWIAAVPLDGLQPMVDVPNNLLNSSTPGSSISE